jgi:hypothetical protein
MSIIYSDDALLPKMQYSGDGIAKVPYMYKTKKEQSSDTNFIIANISCVEYDVNNLFSQCTACCNAVF